MPELHRKAVVLNLSAQFLPEALVKQLGDRLFDLNYQEAGMLVWVLLWAESGGRESSVPGVFFANGRLNVARDVLESLRSELRAAYAVAMAA